MCLQHSSGPDPSIEPLCRLALEGAGWEDLLAELATVLGLDVNLVAVHGGLLAGSAIGRGPAQSRPASGHPASAETEGGLDAATVREIQATGRATSVTDPAGRNVLAAPVSAGRRRVGALFIAEPAPAEAAAVLESAALAFAIVASRRDAEAAVIADEASRLVDELRFGSLRDPRSLMRAASRFGVHLDRPHAAAAFAYEGANRAAWSAAAHWIETPAQLADQRVWTVVSGDIAGELGRVQLRLQGIVAAGRVMAVAGGIVTEVGDTWRSFVEAEALLEYATERGMEGPVELDDIGLAGVFLGAPPDRLRRFVETQLGPIADRPELVETLRAWLDNNGSRAAVAEQLFLHRNTVGYRVKRACELLGRPAQGVKRSLRIRSAMVAMDALEVLEPIHARRSESADTAVDGAPSGPRA